MITTVTLNPCIDRTIKVNDFALEATNRVISTRQDISGKGINVSIALKQLGYDTKCVGINFCQNGGALTHSLDVLGIPHDFAEEQGILRTNIKIFDQTRRTMTELNEGGGFVSEETLSEALHKIEQSAAQSSIVVLSGSVPDSVPKTVYYDIIQAIKKYKIKIIVDAQGALLTEALCSDTYLIKPNISELEQTFECSIQTQAQLIETARKIIARGVSFVCVSMGRQGAVLVGANEVWYAPAPDVKVRGVQGAGDSMVAGICAAIEQGLSVSEMLRYGTATCGGSLMCDGTLMCTIKDFEWLLPKTIVNQIEKRN